MPKKNSALPVILLVALVILGGVAYYIYSQRALDGTSGDIATDITTSLATEESLSPIEGEVDTPTEQDDTDTAFFDEDVAEDADTAIEPAEPVVTAEGNNVEIDVDAALSERGIGNPDAPVVIKEFASLTCGHCGDFHRDVYKELKAAYIDTGEVYLIMVDFPLNGPAVHGSMVARCLPEARYEGFMQLLFENQDKWAYDANYLNYLRQNAALAGLGSEAFDACINNDDLRNGILEARAQAQQEYSINSTPSFVVDESEAFSGTRNFAFFKQVIDAALAETQD